MIKFLLIIIQIIIIIIIVHKWIKKNKYRTSSVKIVVFRKRTRVYFCIYFLFANCLVDIKLGFLFRIPNLIWMEKKCN